MRSPRGNRFRPLLLLALVILTILYLTTGPSSTQTSEFYTRTKAAMESRQKALRDGISGATSPDTPAAKAMQAAEAKVRGSKQKEVVFPEVEDHEGGKGEQVSGKKGGAKEEADTAKAGANGQKPIVEEAKEKAKAAADEVAGAAKKKGAEVAAKVEDAMTGAGKDYSGKGGAKEESGTTKEGAKEYSGKGGHKEDSGAKEGAMKYHGKTNEGDDDDTDAVHGPKDEKVGSSGKKVQGKAGDDDGVAKVGNTGKQVQDEAKKGASNAKSDVDSEAGTKKTDKETEAVLNGILKKSPIIIFSKSYCRFSAKAKRILLEGYKIVPAPFVVELDQHEMGEKLQAALEQTTKRRTVPNVLISGVSIGGGDDVEELDNADKLADKIMELGGKRIMEVKKLSPKTEAKKFKA